MSGTRLVYSTDGGRVPATSERGGRRPSPAGPPVPAAPNDGWVRLWRVKGGRGGKVVTVITGVPGGEAALESLALELRRFAGAGSKVRGSAIELQGDQRERLQPKLEAMGFRVKLAGG